MSELIKFYEARDIFLCLIVFISVSNNGSDSGVGDDWSLSSHRDRVTLDNMLGLILIPRYDYPA